MRQKLLYWSIIPAVIIGLILFLFASALIPTEAIRENARRSGQYMIQNPVYYEIIPDWEPTTIHNYADEMTMNIAYHLNPEKPVESALRAAYYEEEFIQIDKELVKSVEQNLPANKEYMRYWHGGAAVCRVLLTVLTTPGMRILSAVLLAGLLALLCRRLIIGGNRWVLAVLGIGLLMTFVWIVPLCMEYQWCFILMLIVSLLALRLEERGKDLLVLFAVSGIVTNFFDFLTTETLTLTVPMLLVLVQNRKRRQGERLGFSFLWKSCLAWLLGYAGMWALKWVLCTAVLHVSPAEFLTEHVADRSIGVEEENLLLLAAGSLLNNISLLLPAAIPQVGGWIMAGGIFVLIYILYVYHNKDADKAYVRQMLLVGAIPYIRYLALMTHSFDHAYFTFRAQLAAILAVGAVLIETTKKKTNVRRNKKK